MITNGVQGCNRTGIAVSPELGQQLVKAARNAEPSSDGSDAALGDVLRGYSSRAEPVGSIPPRPIDGAEPRPAPGVQASAKTKMVTLIDKLGERLAFERTGTRLYQALLSKLESAPPRSTPGGPSRELIERILREELVHFTLLKQVIEALGGDPTAVTPSADIIAVTSSGVPQVLRDPRTTFQQCLEAMLVVELADNDGWTVLVELAESAVESNVVVSFEQAHAEEEEHLKILRRWVRQGLGVAG